MIFCCSYYDSLEVLSPIQLVLRSIKHSTAGNCAPHQHWLLWPGDVVCGVLLTDCDPGMISYLECPLIRLVTALSWSQTALKQLGARQ